MGVKEKDKEVAERETMIEWCALISGYSKEFFEKMDDTRLKKEYEIMMGYVPEN